jgi:hypothetical protein
MKRKTRVRFIVIALTTMFVSFGLVYPQSNNSVTQINISPGQLYLVDGRGGLTDTGRFYCGAASPVIMKPLGGVGGAMGPFVKLDLSFGYLPFSRVRYPGSDLFSPSESFIGAWAVRTISPASDSFPKSVSLVHFSGPLTSGVISAQRTGTTAFELYGTTSLSGSVCGVERDWRTNSAARRYVRLVGTCGNDQEVTVEVGRWPPTDHDGEIRFETAELFAYGTFRGNISCGQITDRRRVRTDLSN